MNALPAFLTQIEEAPATELARKIKNSLTKALSNESDIDPDILSMVGMSGRKYRHFINNLIRSVDQPRYLEVGCWAGSTLCSAISYNGVKATGIDNWSEFGGPKDHFLANVARYTTPGAHVNFIESDFRKVDYASLGIYNIYLFDGPHEYQDQYDGLVLALPAMEKQFIFIVDDWNWEKVRLGTFGAIKALDINIAYSVEIRSTLDGTQPPVNGNLSDWHNGYFIAVLEKP
jgi:SAM-dependent methyltransferase